MSANLLFTYRCGQCKTLAKTTIKRTAALDMPLKCAVCLRFMSFLFSSEIDQEEWTARSTKPDEFISPQEVAERRSVERKCDTCRTWRAPDQMIELQGVGRFCSQTCADAGVLDHERFMARIQKLRTEMPWVSFPAQKESA